MKVAIVNDTSDVHFGCQLTMEVYREQLNRVGIEIIGTVKMQDKWMDHRDMLDRTDLVIVNGEGSRHHGKRTDLIEISVFYPCVFLNAVYQDNSLNMDRFKLMTVRESESQKQLPGSIIVPDMVFASSRLWNYRKWIKSDGPIYSTDSANGILGISPSHNPEKYFDMLLQSSGICAGRFHAIVACAVLRVPFSAYTSNTHKNKGLMWDMAVEELYSERMEDAIKLIPKKSHPAIGFYAKTAVKRIKKLFESLESYL